MLKKIPIAIEDFREIIEENYYYIDKTKFIEDILNDGAKVKLFCRPRRFGKTLNMSMLKYFFNIEEKEKNKNLFKGLYIENSPIMSEQGKYPVIFFSMKEIKGNNFKEFIDDIELLIISIIKKFQGLKDICFPEEIQLFENLQFRKANFSELKRALKFITELLCRKYGEKVILLIDEYDNPIITAYEKGYYLEMRDFLKAFYGDALKTNEYLQMGVLTGIIRVAQAGIFSDLNNFTNYTILSNDYSQSFGLIEEEVKAMLDYYNIGCEMPEVKKWYDGYSFGKDEIYNPWSILNFVKDKELKSYWINTSSNAVVRNLLSASGSKTLETLEKLFKEEDVIVVINDSVALGQNLSQSELWELMLYSGYLTVKEKIGSEEYLVRIPNKEILKSFKRNFLEILFGEFRTVIQMKNALLNENLREIEECISSIVLNVMSFYDTGKNNEYSYHMLLAGFFYALDGYYTVKSNMETGYGRADIILFPKDKTRAGYILELKRANSKNLDKEAKKALEQIESNKYYIELERYGVKEIVKIGLVFDGKKVVSSYIE